MHDAVLAKILVVVPTYNEADNVAPLLSGIFREAPQVHVLFVDDNSTDGTRAGIEDAQAANPDRVFLLSRAGKLGLGTAYVAGFQWGLARGYTTLIEMDADLSHRAEDLAKLVRQSASHPVVIGSRYTAGGGTQNWGLGRRLISRFGSLYAGIILMLPIRDLTGGFNAWQREVLEALDLSTVRSEGYAFQIELKYRAWLSGFRPLEEPILFVERRAGQSKMSGGIVLEGMLRVWQLALARRAISQQYLKLKALSGRS